MRRSLATVFPLAALTGAACLTVMRVGLPMIALPPPDGALIGALNNMAILGVSLGAIVVAQAAPA